VAQSRPVRRGHFARDGGYLPAPLLRFGIGASIVLLTAMIWEQWPLLALACSAMTAYLLVSSKS